MEIEQIRRENLRGLIEGAPFLGNQAEFARRTGKATTSISRILKGKVMGSDLARELELKIGKPRGWLDDIRNLRQKELAIQPESPGGIEVLMSQETINHNDSVPIPLMNATPRMGIGALRPDYDVVVRRLEVDRGFLRQLSISRPEALALLHAYGDSMAPTFSDGDMLLVDTAVTELRIDATYVLARGDTDEIMVKRVQRHPDGSIKILSDNRALYDPIVLSKEEAAKIQVLGRVVWAWAGKKL